MSAAESTAAKPPETGLVRPLLEAVGLTKRFGTFTALSDVSIRLMPGEVHALLGENGAGKSTLVKCILGYHIPDEGAVMLDGREQEIASPRHARRIGLGMVYQHFTLVPAMTVLENLVMARAAVPPVVNWATERSALSAFLQTMPLRVSLDIPVHRLSAGERQKTEILKEIYLQSRVLILDEPTSVLTPEEAREVLGFLRARAQETGMAILLITHKFAEVTAFCDRVTVLRRGHYAGGGTVAALSIAEMARMMIGERTLAAVPERQPVAPDARTVLAMTVQAGYGRSAIKIRGLTVRAGEILGVAGISGNGQTTLMDVLSGQTQALAGEILVNGAPYHARRDEARAQRVHCLPEEPLRNACVGRMTVAENLAFRSFDRAPDGSVIRLLNHGRMRQDAERLIAAYAVKTQGTSAPIATLSGGNVQRAVLARELEREANLLVVANPCFGLDVGAVADIRAQLMTARNRGSAVLLISEDLDEVLALADRIVVMFEGKIVFETPGGRAADPMAIGAHMAGHGT